ncbi:5941_t:CDS:10, partial [Racocetra persica]
RSLSDEEIVDICTCVNRPERERLTLRKKHLPMSHEQKKEQLRSKKLENFFGEQPPRAQPTGIAGISHRKLRNFFGQRPPSELISSNLTDYFPGHATEDLERSARRSMIRASRRMSSASRTSRTRSRRISRTFEDPNSRLKIIMDVPSTTNKSTDNSTRNSLVNIKPNSFNKQIMQQRHESGQASNRTPGVDINAVGSLDGTSIYDVDLDSVEDKPWRKPGADITDYFNYGFNEYTWKAYCAKQKQMREDQHSRKKIHVYESKQEVNSLPPELQSISQPQSGLDHPRFQQQRGRGRRGRDQDDSVIQVVSSEREAALEELEPIPPPTMDGPQNEDYGMDANGYPHDFQEYVRLGPPMGMRMFPPPDMQMGPPPPFFMGNPEMPPTGPMGFDPTYQGGQPMRRMMRPTGMPGGMPGMATRMPPTMPGGMPGGMPGMPRGMPGMPAGMVGRGRGIAMDERPFFSMDDQSWEMENRNTQTFRPGFAGRPPTGPMHGNRSDFHDWEHSPPPDAPYSHRMRPSFRPNAPPTGPAEQSHHRNLVSSVDSPSSDRGEEENRSTS